ncbi:hypothetical protein Z517_02305 [Fonsecaea pedrosoi CBS 271.37]|uniref:Tyrosinase C-terminal domain-containing protein n=1 Tax=Fonsecaea pedrosoi CBS 271.37 TaxID=1442368 RepID=A0A0D2F8Y1_9EURO|nr:uncharacterized protein Z517_02305 [Fonsecaea pedrosoi CBS 271.37]KIW83062.1 hypothetical protein Z517_02305 [Fonsecaea pedrosoi CBS 271.37]
MTGKVVTRTSQSVVSAPKAQLSSRVLSSQQNTKARADDTHDLVGDTVPTDQPGGSNREGDGQTGLEEIDQDIYPDCLINIIYDRYALGGRPYSIHFFIGDVINAEISGNVSALEHLRHVGSVYTFGRAFGDGDGEHCEDCSQKAEARVLSTAQVPLTISLIHHAEDQDNDDIWHIDHYSVES